LIGKNWLDFTHPDDLERNVLEFEEHFKINKPHKIEKRYIRKNGEIMWVSIGASLRQLTSGNTLGYTAIVMDITERKLMEKEIQERQDEMEQLQKLYVSNQTASAIAHELNQPLLAISAYSRAANMMFKSGQYETDEICEALNSIESQAYRAGKAIRDILDSLMTKEFAAEVLDLNQEIVSGINAAILEHGLQFNLTFNLERRHTLVRANRIHLQKVLVNLLQNAADAMKESGVSQPLINVITCWINDKNIAQVTIQDNGSGIQEKDTKHMFDAFFTTKKDGIGMGLAISRSLIEENGGRLWFEPTSGPGATFHLTLPIAI
jgi:two-component system sensor kinase FixL